MDIKHTQEPWKFLEQGDADEYCLVTADGLKWVIAFRINGEMMPDMQRANARRIVACVNRLAPFKTEDIEDLGCDLFADDRPRFDEAMRKVMSLTKERDTAWEELRKIREAIKANPEESTFDEVLSVLEQRDPLLHALKLARAFIANGIEVGAIRMPDSTTPDPANETLPLIDAIIAKVEAA